MIRLLSLAARAGLAVSLAALTLGVARWGPVHAEPPWDTRALSAAGAAVVCAVVAGLTGRQRRPRRIRALLVALAATTTALAGAVWLRGPAGLEAVVSDPRGPLARLPAGPVDLAGRDLGSLPHVRKWSIRWSGVLRAPRTGTYRLWVDGRGRAEVWLDGRPVLEAEAERLRAGADVVLTQGEHALEVRLQRVGPGPRLRLGWRRPSGWWRGGRDELIPPRYLGRSRPAWLWTLTDLLAISCAVLVAWLAWAAPWDRPRRLLAPAEITRAEVVTSLAAHAVVVALMSWPLVFDLAGSGVVDRPDGRLNAWILAWDAHAMLHDPGRLFQAPIFHPLPDTLAFSENLLVPALLAAPATLLAGPVLGYNVVLLGSFVISGLGVQLLVQRAGGDRLAAFVGGALFAAGAHRWIRLAHLHAQVTLFLPFVLLALDRFWQRRTLGRAALVGLLLALQGLSSVYLGAITALAVAAAVLAALVGGLRGREALRLSAGLVVGALLLAPLAGPYLRMRAFQGVEWGLEEVATHATTLDSYAASGTRLYGPLTQRHLDPDRVRDTMFPGLVPLLLGLAGLAAAPRRYRAVALLASGAAVLFSLGPETGLYRYLHEHVVLVRGVRALSRFSLIPVLALCVLTGLAVAGRWRAGLLALSLGLLESSQVPIRYAPYRGPSEAARWLAGRAGAVVRLPLGEDDTGAMLDAVAHFRPLVNGDSGFVPRAYVRAQELLSGALSDEGLAFLRAVGVSHVVAREELALPLAARLEPDFVYALSPGEAARVPASGVGAASLWSARGAQIDLGRPQIVSRVVFELSDDPWQSRPSVSVSPDGLGWTAIDARASLGSATLSLYRDPRRGRGEVRFAPVTARLVRLDPRLPMRPGSLEAGN